MAFQPLLDKINTRIHAWQSKLLSQASRIELIKSILSPFTYYQMQTTILPRSITSSVDKYISDLYGVTRQLTGMRTSLIGRCLPSLRFVVG